jgi:hypothetical protein
MEREKDIKATKEEREWVIKMWKKYFFLEELNLRSQRFFHGLFQSIRDTAMRCHGRYIHTPSKLQQKYHSYHPTIIYVRF